MREPNEKRLASRLRWILAGFALLMLGLFFFQLLGPNSPIIVSKETTFITEPLGSDGLPDYAAYLDQQASDGVTPENNAAVLIWQAMWPGELEQKHWLAMCNALGMQQVPSEAESLTDYDSEAMLDQIVLELEKRYVETADLEPAVGNLAEMEAEEVEGDYDDEDYDDTEFLESKRKEVLRWKASDAIDEAMAHPWTSKQIPTLAQWVEQNQQPLDLLVEASRRPRYYSPSPSHLGGKKELLIATLLPDIQMMRECLRVLQLRAMYHLGEGRIEEAWQDLHASHRLARLVAEDSTLVGQLVAIAMEGFACRGTEQLLQEGNLNSIQARQIFKKLNELGPAASCLRALDQGERLIFLDIVNHIAKGNTEILEDFGASEQLLLISKGRINWNTVLREGNVEFDNYITAAKLPTRNQRVVAFQDLKIQLSRQSQIQFGPTTVLASLLSKSQRTKTISQILRTLLPVSSLLFQVEDRSITQLELTRLAAALAVYRAEQDEYPEQLADLIPSVLEKLPLDLYSGKSFLYQRKDDGGYLLYSVFENEIDDLGTGQGGSVVKGEWVDKAPDDFDYQASDLVIRIPTPKFKFPAPPTKAELRGFDDEYAYGFDDDDTEEEDENAEAAVEEKVE